MLPSYSRRLLAIHRSLSGTGQAHDRCSPPWGQASGNTGALHRKFISIPRTLQIATHMSFLFKVVLRGHPDKSWFHFSPCFTVFHMKASNSNTGARINATTGMRVLF
jgi:hypothetical protein